MASSNGNAIDIPDARNAARRDIFEEFTKADIGHLVRFMRSMGCDFRLSLALDVFKILRAFGVLLVRFRVYLKK